VARKEELKQAYSVLNPQMPFDSISYAKLPEVGTEMIEVGDLLAVLEHIKQKG